MQLPASWVAWSGLLGAVAIATRAEATATAIVNPAWRRRDRRVRATDRALVRAAKGRLPYKRLASATDCLEAHHGSSAGDTSSMGKDEGGSRQGRTGIWWPCKCGGWPWADRVSCPKCAATCPKWCRTYRTGNNNSNRVRGAAGNAPATLVVWDFVVPGNGRRAQRKARQLVRALADAKVSPELQAEGAAVLANAEHAVVGDVDMASACAADASNTADLDSRLAEAEATVAKWEAIPATSRELLPGFEERLAGAREARDVVLRERRAARPWMWRLLAAERQQPAPSGPRRKLQRRSTASSHSSSRWNNFHRSFA